MTREELSQAVGGISARHIEAAARPPRSAAPRRKRRGFIRAAVLAAALAACLLLAVPALAAADVQPAYEFLYAFSPELAQKLKPVRLSCEDNGVRMEVVSAAIDGDTAEILLSLRDLTGDRVDETTDLFDSYSIHRPFSSSATCRLERYDQDTRTAYFLIHLTQWDGREIGGKKITFSFSRFLSKKQNFSGPIPEVDLSTAAPAAEAQTKVDLRGWSGSAACDRFLLPGSGPDYSPVPGVTITALGYIDGKLHVQAYYEDILETDNHGTLWLRAENGAEYSCEASGSFWDEEQRGSYEEYVFSVPAEDLAGCTLWGDLTVCGSLTEGNWQVTFPLSGEA
ncbi:MAG: hypothetical protein ACI3WR_06320 [Oscillospiraceae bacterium]